MVAYVRRLEILDVLCQRRHEIMSNLADEFNVCVRTIQNDILELSLNFPLYTKTGYCGGVFVSDGYCIGRKYLNDSQVTFLKEIKSSYEEEQGNIIQSILTQFSKPNTWVNNKNRI